MLKPGDELAEAEPIVTRREGRRVRNNGRANKRLWRLRAPISAAGTAVFLQTESCVLSGGQNNRCHSECADKQPDSDQN